MTWLECKRKIMEVASRLTTEAVPITFMHGETEIRPDDITVVCEMEGDELALVIDLKERTRHEHNQAD